MSPQQGQIIMGIRISDTRIMRREIHYVHPQYGCTLLLDTLHQAAVCSGKNAADKCTYIDRLGENY